MKLFITGDIHGKLDFQKLQPRFFPLRVRPSSGE
jgi:hypothetical protein